MSAMLHRLSNGLTVAVDPMAEVETVAVGLYADVGARSERKGKAGLAHMVEHMLFKGAGPRDAKAIAEHVEDVGGSLNAWTARDQTVFHARLLGGDLALGVEIIADLVRSAHLAEDELAREKGVVLSELGEARDTPDDIVFDHLQGAAFPDQAIGAPVLGDEASIDGFTRDDLTGWLATHYRPESLVLAAAGKVDADALLKLAEARFGDLPAGGRPEPAPARYVGGRHADRRKFDQTHVTLAFPTVGLLDPALHAIGLFSHAAGGGMSSRLFQEVREARGLAYSIYSWSHHYADAGLFGLYLAAGQGDAGKALALAREILTAVADNLDEAELARAKAYGRASFLMGLEGVQARCDHLARQIQIHGRIVPAAESVGQMEAVTLAEARAAGAAAIGGGETLASVGGKLKDAA
ncbi:M16 family metallopeptidase [Sphingomonas jatrophae]|uniref:Predicted Zn-dependent peptidase n=1 Tax=Sphingomonas jatrophae TaxID=1166337 RepID=A0A1I6LED6_9SPHN|nr:pitrilysin family protein [Sphingomonas jatrophae]SFS01807.1 Predicted Zn-dependent peptidase [Sphingomonas jatrophae]